ncbi:hypothetical protein ACFL2R_02000 [Patescibacteria group bacterium]
MKKIIVGSVIVLILAVTVVIFVMKVEKHEEASLLTIEAEVQVESEQEIPVVSTLKGLKFEELQSVDVAGGPQIRMLLVDDKFHVTSKVEKRSLVIKTFDTDLVQYGDQKSLENTVGPDYKITNNGKNFFLSDAKYLRKYDLNWKEINAVSYYDLFPAEIVDGWPNGVDDMILSYGNESIFVGSAVGKNTSKTMKKGEKKEDLADGMYVQEFDLDLKLKNALLIEGIGNVPSSSIVVGENGYQIISSDKHWDDSSLIVLAYDRSWKLLDRKVISSEPEANENFPMTVLFEDGIYYVAYHHITGDISQPTRGKYNPDTEVVVKAYDRDWNFMGRLPKESGSFVDSHDITSWFDIAISNDKLYLILNANKGAIFKEYLIKKLY